MRRLNPLLDPILRLHGPEPVKARVRPVVKFLHIQVTTVIGPNKHVASRPIT